MMKCNICGDIDETDTAYCIKCGRSPHTLINETKNNIMAEIEKQSYNINYEGTDVKLFKLSQSEKGVMVVPFEFVRPVIEKFERELADEEEAHHEMIDLYVNTLKQRDEAIKENAELKEKLKRYEV